LIGFSDVTALHGFLASRAGMASLHGPLLSTLRLHDSRAWDAMIAALQGAPPPPLSMDTVCEGEGEGPLIGGNLSLVAALAGTSCFPSLRGAIVFVEEVGEPPYRIDRSLTGLMMRGLGEAAGVVFGDMGAVGDRYVPEEMAGDCVRARVDRLLCGAGIPVGWGAPFGHRLRNETLAFGTTARLVCSSGGAVLTMTRAVEGGP
jgi:muramoyltetrapeptide carboxypeptidase